MSKITWLNEIMKIIQNIKTKFSKVMERPKRKKLK